MVFGLRSHSEGDDNRTDWDFADAAAAYNNVTNGMLTFRSAIDCSILPLEASCTNSLFPGSGPVAQNVKDQHAKTQAEFSNLAASRQRPINPTATGQPLTHYHSFFSELLSWNNPRKYSPKYL
jgi:hypothetical protein